MFKYWDEFTITNKKPDHQKFNHYIIVYLEKG